MKLFIEGEGVDQVVSVMTTALEKAKSFDNDWNEIQFILLALRNNTMDYETYRILDYLLDNIK